MEVVMKVLASDYDGTLRTAQLVDVEDVKAIQKFRAAGNVFGIVTGRSMESISMEIQRNALEFDFIVANNGGVIYDKDLQKLECIYMDFNKALDIIAYIKTLECVSFVINDGYHRYKILVDANQIDHKYGDMPGVEDQEETILDRGKIAQLVISLNDTVLADEIAQYINTNFRGYALAYVNVNCVDIVPSGVSKAQGLYYMENHLDLAHDDIYAIGDSFNDLPMIEEFHGCAVEHARSAIKDRAAYVFKSVSNCIEALMKEDEHAHRS